MAGILLHWQPVGPAPAHAAQAAKTTLFAAGNEADVRKTAAGQFFQCISAAVLAAVAFANE